MPLIQCSPRVLLLRRQRFTPHHPFPASTFALPVRRSTALRAEPEPQPPPDTYDDSGDGPVEIRAPTLFSVDDNPTPLQVATSVMLTGAISVFLFRSLRRRARRAKELRVRSGGMEKPRNLSEEALEALRMVSTSPVETNKPPSPVQALLGGIAAGVIALFLYKFATTVEASLNRQTISDNFSVRQITVTISDALGLQYAYSEFMVHMDFQVHLRRGYVSDGENPRYRRSSRPPSVIRQGAKPLQETTD
uniref:Uncharacterized protein n=1 Tax=Aegilops tauschii TaxID=37682 RepID=M8CDI7_AEGTA